MNFTDFLWLQQAIDILEIVLAISIALYTTTATSA